MLYMSHSINLHLVPWWRKKLKENKTTCIKTAMTSQSTEKRLSSFEVFFDGPLLIHQNNKLWPRASKMADGTLLRKGSLRGVTCSESENHTLNDFVHSTHYHTKFSVYRKILALLHIKVYWKLELQGKSSFSEYLVKKKTTTIFLSYYFDLELTICFTNTFLGGGLLHESCWYFKSGFRSTCFSCGLFTLQVGNEAMCIADRKLYTLC